MNNQIKKFLRLSKIEDHIREYTGESLDGHEIYPFIKEYLIYSAEPKDHITIIVIAPDHEHLTTGCLVREFYEPPYLIPLTQESIEKIYSNDISKGKPFENSYLQITTDDAINIAKKECSYIIGDVFFTDVVGREAPHMDKIVNHQHEINHDQISSAHFRIEDYTNDDDEIFIKGNAYIFAYLASDFFSSHLSIKTSSIEAIEKQLMPYVKQQTNKINKNTEQIKVTEKENLLITIGALASTIANDHENKFKKGDDVNVSQVTNYVLGLIGDKLHGIGKSSLNDRISKGVKLLVQAQKK